ncbi:MAG: GNAT family N-acetyltransferase [Bacillota bacterium]
MVKIENMSELQVLPTFKKGILTNNFITKADYEKEIRLGQLHLQKNDDNCLVLKQRNGFAIGYFHFMADVDFQIFEEIKESIYIEIPYKNRNKAVLQEFANKFMENGFTFCFERKKYELTITEESTFDTSNVKKAELENAKEIYDLLYAYYPVETGCLPDFEGVETHIKNDEVYTIVEDEKIVGLLTFYSKLNKMAHLVVDKDYRGKGYLAQLMHTYLQLHYGKKTVIWAGENTAGIYLKYGYHETEFGSIVLRK